MGGQKKAGRQKRWNSTAAQDAKWQQSRDFKNAVEAECSPLKARIHDLENDLRRAADALGGFIGEKAKKDAEADQPVPMILWCPKCGGRHLDEGEFATRRHHTHACQTCGVVWRPALVPTVGVRFLPGFRNERATDKAPEIQPHSLRSPLVDLGRNGSGPAMFCDHANECPLACPCETGCYCKGRTCPL